VLKGHGARRTVKPLNPDGTLYETASREVWQSLLVTSDHHEVGPVVRQVIEPGMYTIRYFVVYDLPRQRHILLPSNSVVDIADGRVYCSLRLADVMALPAFVDVLDREYEKEVYEAAGRTPYWVEEQRAAEQAQSAFIDTTAPGCEPDCDD